MKIAVLGWGSLIWNPGHLKIKYKKWQKDGPNLPVEFARISKDGRLTLILYPEAERVQVLWNYMNVVDLAKAIENLRERECIQKGREDRIGYLDLTTGKSRCEVIPEVKDEIEEWAKEKKADAVIWTDLPSNFEDKTGKKFNEKAVLDYLRNLEACKKEKAKQYIVKAPKQIITKIRKRIESELGWSCKNNCS